MSVYIRSDSRGENLRESRAVQRHMWRRGPRLNKYPEPESGAAMQRCEVLRPGGQNAARGKIKPLLWVAHSDPRPRRLNQKLPAYAEHHNLSGGAAGEVCVVTAALEPPVCVTGRF